MFLNPSAMVVMYIMEWRASSDDNLVVNQDSIAFHTSAHSAGIKKHRRVLTSDFSTLLQSLQASSIHLGLWPGSSHPPEVRINPSAPKFGAVSARNDQVA